MSDVVWYNEGIEFMQDQIYQTPWVTLYELRLIESTTPPSPSDAWPAPYAEPVNPGYSAKGIGASNWTVASSSGDTTVTLNSQLWAFSATGNPTQTIYGWWIQHPLANKLLCGGLFPTPFLLTGSGGSLFFASLKLVMHKCLATSPPPPPPPPPPTVYLKDTFTDSDGTSLTAHTMDIGPGWTVYAGGWEIESDAGAISSSTGLNSAAADASVSDCVVEADVTPGDNSCGICFRLTDASNYWWVECDNFAQKFRLVEWNAGSVINRGEVAVTLSPTTAVHVKAVMNGASITVTMDGGHGVTYGSATFNQSATRHGLWSYLSTNDTVDNFTTTGL